MTASLTDRVKRVNPDLLKGKGPDARVRFKKRLALHVAMMAQQQARGFSPKGSG